MSAGRASPKCEVVRNRETVRSGVGASRLFAVKRVSLEAMHICDMGNAYLRALIFLLLRLRRRVLFLRHLALMLNDVSVCSLVLGTTKNWLDIELSPVLVESRWLRKERKERGGVQNLGSFDLPWLGAVGG